MEALLWWAKSDLEKAQVLDESAEMGIEAEAAHEAMRHAGKLWVSYIDFLIETGADPKVAESVCFEGWDLERKLERFHRLSHEYTDFEYPGSCEVVPGDQAISKAAQSLDERGLQIKRNLSGRIGCIERSSKG